jgi:two-component system NtrC family sensor kinase
MYNSGHGLRELIAIQKIVHASIVLGTVFLWVFVAQKFELKGLRYVYLLLALLAVYLLYLILFSPVNLIYREGVIEPLVIFNPYLPIKPFFAMMWLITGIYSWSTAARFQGGRRTLLYYSGGAAFGLLSSFLCSYLYSRSGESGFLLTSWVLMLLAILFALLGEIVPPDSPEARSPIKFLGTRLLFKLILIFVLLVIILFEATTLATINISKHALSQSIQSTYLKTAEELANRIEANYSQPPLLGQLQKLLLSKQPAFSGTTFIVDQEGRLLFHPDAKRALQRENLSSHQAVKNLLTSKSGAGEFLDEWGETAVGAYVPIPKFGWGLVVEEPRAIAYIELRSLETNSLLFIITGIILTSLTGVFFAHSIERPIKGLIYGTEVVARGDLSYQIKAETGDEIGKLAQAFNTMTRELRDSQARLILSEKLASLGTMAAGMAHEIKNPLVSIRTFTQLLQQKWDDKDFRDKFSSLIPQEIERINRIAESLLKFGKPLKPETVPIDLNALLDEVVMLFESECKRAKVQVTKKLTPLPKIVGDFGQISQAFVNIIKNAVEAMQEKGGELIIKTDVGEIIKLDEQGTNQPVPAVFVEFSDTGEGIAEQNLKSLFDPFFTTKLTGTGMGLPITLRIIEEHKATIKVRSKRGEGTTFIISFPLAA